MKSLSAIILGLVFVVGAAHADDKKKKDDPNQIGNRDVGKGINLYSLEKEMALGKQLAQEVERQAKVVDDPIMAEYVNRVGQNLVRNSDAKVPFTFKLIEDESPNAFALPGGYVFVHTGLIKLADEEDEFAGALAHEIAHVAARHMTRQMTKQQLMSIARIPLCNIVGGWGGYAACQGAGVAIPTAFLTFSRSDESEADYLGVQYMYSAGYDPNGTISIFEKLEALQSKNPGFFDKLFSTHPMDGVRITRTQDEIQKILAAKDEYVVSTSEYHDMRARLLRLENSRKIGGEKDGRPVLRRSTPDARDEKEDRPTIKRRDLVE